MTFMRVDLPAPLGPSTATKSPRCTVTSTPLSTGLPARRALTPRTLTAGVDAGAGAVGGAGGVAGEGAGTGGAGSWGLAGWRETIIGRSPGEARARAPRAVRPATPESSRRPAPASR